jgi:hypothetical protein
MGSEFERDMARDLHWLAFRYVAGETDAAETAAFEDRLDHDQAAREAVARVVDLAGAVASLPSEPQTLGPIRRRRSIRALVGAVTLAAAACLGWMALTFRVLVPAPGGDRQTAATLADPTVALAWSTLHQERVLDRDDSGGLLAWNDDLPAAIEADDAADLGLPPWLVDAASLGGRPDQAAKPGKEL